MTSELEGLTVYGETQVGWDENAPINAPVTDPALQEKLLPDLSAPKRRVYDDPEVKALRKKLRRHNGIYGLEISEPHETEKIARIFHRDGFAVVKDLLNPNQLACWREACAEVLHDILSIPSPDNKKYVTETGRLPHRYSYSTASGSGQMFHHPVWAGMIDLPTTIPIVSEIFGSTDYRVWGAGGDACLPGAVEYQHLHHDYVDLQYLSESRIEQAKRLKVVLDRDDNGNLDTRSQKRIIEATPPLVTINFMMSDLTWENGSIRQVPGTHALQQVPPPPWDEPDWMKHSTLVGMTAGSGVFRDLRAWHGATPNLSKEIRAMPNIEYGAPWWEQDNYEKVMPYEMWKVLTPRAQQLSEWVKADPGVWPTGAGMIRLAGEVESGVSDPPRLLDLYEFSQNLQR